MMKKEPAVFTVWNKNLRNKKQYQSICMTTQDECIKR